MHHVVKTLNVVNDVAERSIKFIQDFSGKITKGDAERDNLLQSVEQHRKTKVMTKKQSFSDISLRLIDLEQYNTTIKDKVVIMQDINI